MIERDVWQTKVCSDYFTLTARQLNCLMDSLVINLPKVFKFRTCTNYFSCCVDDLCFSTIQTSCMQAMAIELRMEINDCDAIQTCGPEKYSLRQATNMETTLKYCHFNECSLRDSMSKNLHFFHLRKVLGNLGQQDVLLESGDQVAKGGSSRQSCSVIDTISCANRMQKQSFQEPTPKLIYGL